MLPPPPPSLCLWIRLVPPGGDEPPPRSKISRHDRLLDLPCVRRHSLQSNLFMHSLFQASLRFHRHICAVPVKNGPLLPHNFGLISVVERRDDGPARPPALSLKAGLVCASTVLTLASTVCVSLYVIECSRWRAWGRGGRALKSDYPRRHSGGNQAIGTNNELWINR